MQREVIMIEAYHTDNMLLMNEYSSKYFPLAIVDPEYGIGESGKKRTNFKVKQKNGTILKAPENIYVKKNWDNKPAGDEYFTELKRVSLNQIIFGANYFQSIMEVQKPPRRDKYADFLNKYPLGFIIWDKVNGDNDFSDCEVIYTSFNFPSFVLPYMWSGMMQGVSINRGTVMQGNKKLNEKRIHPTQKPIIIYKYLLLKFAKIGSKILDTHLGSGSIAIACNDLGYDLVACDNDFEIFTSAIKRLSIHQSQTSLFA